ncbi:MAG TPA: Ger(x)C family spore germination protein [Bacillota bacterium]|nr:Ger(x)C family spore germination protein [Bacillota bacterium]
MKSKEIRRLWIFIIPLLFLIPGCKDFDDIDRRAIVIALGLDTAPDNQVMASAQIPLVETSPISLGAQPSEKPFHTITSQGNTALEAIQELENKAVKSLFWGQLKVVIISTALAERGLKKYSEFLERHPEIPPTTNMALTETTSQEILSVGLSSKFLPGMAMDDYFEEKVKADEVYPILTWQFVKGIEVKPKDTYLPIIAYDQAEQVYNIRAIGAFHRDRLAGKLPENETRMAGIIMGKSDNATYKAPIGEMGTITYRRVISKSKLTLQKTRPNIEFLVKVSAKGFGPSITSDRTGLSAKDIKKIEKATAESMKKDILTSLRHLQQLNTDIIGFGDYIRANKPEVWKSLNWDQDYPLADFRVNVKFTLERVGKYR